MNPDPIASDRPRQAPASSLATRWACFAREALPVGLAFFGVYPLCNWVADGAATHYHPYLTAELGIPFVPQFIWAYLSMYLLFLMPPWFLDPDQLVRLRRALVAGTLAAGAAFLLFPCTLGFPREVPADPVLATVYQALFGIDLPHNLVPSLHVVYSAQIVFAILGSGKIPLRRVLFGAWLLLICLSTLLVHQHHVLDVLAGLALAALMQRLFFGRQDDVEIPHDPGPGAVRRDGAGGRA